MVMSNLEKLDFAFENTLDKYNGQDNGRAYLEMFVKQFCKSGYNPTLFTRNNNARQISSSLNTEMILSEMIKYANRAKYISLEKRYDAELYRKYPFLTMNNFSILEYASISEENLKNVIEFFIDKRYGRFTDYGKQETDRLEIFESCREEDKKINSFFNLNNHQR